MAGERKQKVLSKAAAMATMANMEKKRYPKLSPPAKARVDPVADPDSAFLKLKHSFCSCFRRFLCEGVPAPSAEMGSEGPCACQGPPSAPQLPRRARAALGPLKPGQPSLNIPPLGLAVISHCKHKLFQHSQCWAVGQS